MMDHAAHIDRESARSLSDAAWRSTLRHVRDGETDAQAAWQERYREVAGMWVDHGGEG